MDLISTTIILTELSTNFFVGNKLFPTEIPYFQRKILLKITFFLIVMIVPKLKETAPTASHC